MGLHNCKRRGKDFPSLTNEIFALLNVLMKNLEIENPVLKLSEFQCYQNDI
jgi:hypothetical protein